MKKLKTIARAKTQSRQGINFLKINLFALAARREVIFLIVFMIALPLQNYAQPSGEEILKYIGVIMLFRR